MANVIDTLVVELALDPTKFTAAQQQALQLARQAVTAHQQAALQIEAAGQRMENFYRGLKREALGFVAAFFGGRGIKEFVEYITKFDAALGRSAHTLDMHASELNAWQGVARATGGSAESITGSMQGLTDQIQRGFVTGQWGALLQIFNRFGINLRDANGHLKTAGELLFDLNRAFSSMDPATARTLLAMLGLDPSTINVVLMNRDALRQLYETQRLNASATDEDAAAGARLLTNWERATTAAENFGRKIKTWVLEPLASPVLKAAAVTFGAIARVMEAMGTDTLQGAAARARAARESGQQGNFATFNAGLSFLESSGTGVSIPGAPGGGGFFGVTEGFARDAMKAGFGDPRFGSYEEQSAIITKMIEKFHPDAAAAIRRGDFASAAAMLNRTWVGLPGGSEPQSTARMREWGRIMERGQPAAGAPAAAVTNTTVGGDTNTTNTVSISGPIHVNVKEGGDADAIARGIGPALRRALVGFPANTGPQ